MAPEVNGQVTSLSLVRGRAVAVHAIRTARLRSGIRAGRAPLLRWWHKHDQRSGGFMRRRERRCCRSHQRGKVSRPRGRQGRPPQGAANTGAAGPAAPVSSWRRRRRDSSPHLWLRTRCDRQRTDTPPSTATAKPIRCNGTRSERERLGTQTWRARCGGNPAQLQSIPSLSSLHGLVLFPTISLRNHSNLSSERLPEIRTSLGDQGSQVRVLSPRRTPDLSSQREVAWCVWAHARPRGVVL